jgi:3D (Asp-Asp-Asp) domain-containing protein
LKGLIIAIGLVLPLACQAFAGNHSVLARITVYWHGEGSGEHASWNGTRLRDGYCAVDPRKIPYGSKVVFRDAACVANRKAARSCGRSAVERNAIVIDRFFDTKQEALAWSKANPYFMTVQIQTGDAKHGIKIATTETSGSSPPNLDLAPAE